MSAPQGHTLPKEERLCGKTNVAALLSDGKWGATAHLRYCWAAGRECGLNRIMVAVPKRTFKRAVKRNLLKRRIREAFRLQKELLLTPDPSGQAKDLSTPGTDTPATAHTARRYDILFTYSAPDVRSYEEIRAAVAAILTDIRTLSH